ncbi:MAG: methylenetetrahydrofolate reductase [Chloroflexi bacterium]|nr:methylenetetrahydrofolate reductase [Chloroflexota bacterium]
MAHIAVTQQEAGRRPLIICDFSPPRGSDTDMLEPARTLDVDWISMAYNPGRSVRVNSAFAAQWVKANTGKDVVFTLATRDMNKLAVQSLLLGAQLQGLENVVVVKGDDFTERDLALNNDVNDFTPSQMITSIASMNDGLDFRGLKLRRPTQFCIGATIDMGRDLDRELLLTNRKIRAGAQFLMSQPTFTSDTPLRFNERYADRFRQEISVPVFHGVQVMAPEAIVFGDIPRWVTDDLDKGRPGRDVALQVLDDFASAGLDTIYLVPPIMRGGRRDYETTQEVLEVVRR